MSSYKISLMHLKAFDKTVLKKRSYVISIKNLILICYVSLEMTSSKPFEIRIGPRGYL